MPIVSSELLRDIRAALIRAAGVFEKISQAIATHDLGADADGH